MLEILAGCDAQVSDVHQGDAGAQRPLDGTIEGLGGDAGVGEVAVEEAGGAGYLVEGEAPALPGEPVDRREDLEAKRDQLLQPPANLVHGQVHGLVEARDLGDLDEGRRPLGQTPDEVFVEVAAGSNTGERHPSIWVVVASERSEGLRAAKAAGPHLLAADEEARCVPA